MSVDRFILYNIYFIYKGVRGPLSPSTPHCVLLFCGAHICWMELCYYTLIVKKTKNSLNINLFLKENKNVLIFIYPKPKARVNQEHQIININNSLFVSASDRQTDVQADTQTCRQTRRQTGCCSGNLSPTSSSRAAGCRSTSLRSVQLSPPALVHQADARRRVSDPPAPLHLLLLHRPD